MSDKKFKISLIVITAVGLLSMVVLTIITIMLFKQASIIEVISRLG